MQRCKIVGNVPACSDGAAMAPCNQYNSGSSGWPSRQDTASYIPPIQGWMLG